MYYLYKIEAFFVREIEASLLKQNHPIIHSYCSGLDPLKNKSIQ